MGVNALAAALLDHYPHAVAWNRLAHSKPKPFVFILRSNQGFKATDTPSSSVELVDINGPLGAAARASWKVERCRMICHS
jgi:hypothetical protein